MQKPILSAVLLVATLLLGAPVLIGQDTSVVDDLGDGVFAEIRTSLGTMVVQLEFEKAPRTSLNFVLLAEGQGGWIDPKSGEYLERPFYDGLIFHRVKDNFMIQTGCPIGEGTAGPGYRFEDEFVATLRHSAVGTLSMANSGPNTNGGQFFITLVPTPHLDDKHSVFGRLVRGEEVLTRIGSVETGPRDKPVEEVRLERVIIHRVGAAAQSFGTRESLAALRAKSRKDVPAPTGEIDPARVPGTADVELPDKWDCRFVLIRFRGAKLALWDTAYDQAGALEVATRITQLARTQGTDFQELVAKYSDSPEQDFTTFRSSVTLPEFMAPVRRLGMGQVSDPIETPMGYYIFQRVQREVISARHILIGYTGATRSRARRSKDEARKIAEEVLAKAQAGEDFAQLALTYSDGPSKSRGGDLGEFTRGQMVRAFSDAAFVLEVGGVSGVVETQFGFHVIQRYK